MVRFFSMGAEVDVLSGNEKAIPFRMILANRAGEESGFFNGSADFDVGSTNDFEITLSTEEWDPDEFAEGNMIFIPNTEFGGFFSSIDSKSTTGQILISGDTWRGMLAKKIVCPPADSDHIVLVGELNTLIRQLIGERFGDFFRVPVVDSGVIASGWQVDRYVTLLDALNKLVSAKNCRLKIEYKEEGYVSIQAERCTDYSDKLEATQSSHVDLNVSDFRNGINHLVCAGTGQNEERAVLHLYLQADGSVGSKQFHKGIDEREAVFENTSADLAELEKGGRERFEELRNYKKFTMSVNDMDLELGDIVAGYDAITETSVKQPIVGKILKHSSAEGFEIEYKIKGDE